MFKMMKQKPSMTVNTACIRQPSLNKYTEFNYLSNILRGHTVELSIPV